MPDTSPLVLFGQKSWRWLWGRLGATAKRKAFRKWYFIISVILLATGTVYWAVLGAKLQQHNADQLSDPYLFSSWAAFHGASFPSAHTFLLKWPIFLLLGVIGVSPASLLVTTVAVCSITVGVLGYILYKIERRPLVLGTVYLALALALLLVPTQPYAGGILPVNMAMLTTRNLEYIAYLASLMLFIRAPRIRNRQFVLGVGSLSVLMASDKLFLSLSAGGALLALFVYALTQHWAQVTFAIRWLAGTAAALVGSTFLLGFIAISHLTHIAAGSGLGPYSVAVSAKSLVLGISYAFLGLFTNAGANPVYDLTILGALPRSLSSRLVSISGLAHLIAALTFIAVLVLAWRLIWPTLHKLPKRSPKVTLATQLSLALFWSTIAALGVFVVTNHYYAVDARYLSISLFAAAVMAATVLRKQRWRQPERLVVAGFILCIGLAAGTFAAYGAYTHQNTALTSLTERNQLVVQALSHHKVDVLVGDYWRVLPIKLASQGNLTVTPLGNCTQPTTVLTSSAWQPDLTKHSFAYLVTLNGSLTDFPSCTLPQITSIYGRPNATQIIAGTLAKPQEALLFYDGGLQKSIIPSKHTTPASLKPISLDELPATNCNQPTIMNVVAHQDDDLLFLSPDLLHDIRAGNCVRTVFLTAGDGGNAKLYWLNRQFGSETAYNHMLGAKMVWEQQAAQIADGEYVTVASPRGNPKISLVFFNLPDGDLTGDGFAVSQHQSLAKLYIGTLNSIRSVDGQSTYTSGQLINALSMLMNVYQPAEIHTQAAVPSVDYPDHSDHITTGQFAIAATTLYDQDHFGGALSLPIKRYIGYPIHGYPGNVYGKDLQDKEAAFLAYAAYDGGVCHTLSQCAQTPTYGAYISRQYLEDALDQ